MFRHNSAGIDSEARTFALLPEGKWFVFKILEAKEAISTKSGNNMLNLTCEVINDQENNGEKVFHTVVFIPKGKPGDGMSVHFRKCIGEAFGGDDIVDNLRWIGKTFRGKIKHEVYQGRKNHKLSEVSPNQDVDEVPF